MFFGWHWYQAQIQGVNIGDLQLQASGAGCLGNIFCCMFPSLIFCQPNCSILPKCCHWCNTKRNKLFYKLRKMLPAFSIGAIFHSVLNALGYPFCIVEYFIYCRGWTVSVAIWRDGIRMVAGSTTLVHLCDSFHSIYNLRWEILRLFVWGHIL